MNEDIFGEKSAQDSGQESGFGLSGQTSSHSNNYDNSFGEVNSDSNADAKVETSPSETSVTSSFSGSTFQSQYSSPTQSGSPSETLNSATPSYSYVPSDSIPSQSADSQTAAPSPSQNSNSQSANSQSATPVSPNYSWTPNPAPTPSSPVSNQAVEPAATPPVAPTSNTLGSDTQTSSNSFATSSPEPVQLASTPATPTAARGTIPVIPTATPTTTATPEGQPTNAPKPTKGVGKIVVLTVVLSVILTSGLIIGGLRSGLLAPVTTANVAKNYETEQYNKAFEKNEGLVDWNKLYATVAPQVVSILLTLPQGGVQGSGFVLDNKGHIITNNHVVESADKGKLEVTLSDGRIFSTKVVGTDPTTDIAVIALENAPDDLQPVKFSDSDNVTVGDQVMAVGNPLGLASTATVGVVSAIDRPVAASDTSGSSTVTNAIQIDAAINPGNSGGPLFNANGEVIGITSSIAQTSANSGSIGIGFAIPSNLTRLITDQLVANGAADHPALGVTIKDGTVAVDGADRRAAVVQEVGDGTPAKNAGIQKGDAIIGVNDKPIISTYSLIGFVREQSMNSSVKVTYVRDGKKYDTTMKLDRKQEEVLSKLPQQQQQPDGGFDPFDGFGNGN
jgi:putative serine protease PepD